MAGHNKWSKIKHKKAATDAQKSKIFGRLVRLIKIEAKKAGGNTDAPGLKAAIEKAKAANMPKDNIERALKSAESGGDDLEAITYESYGPGGVAIIIETLTDSRNRTAAEIKHIFTKRGLALASPGAASWAFTKEGVDWTPNQTTEVSDEDGAKLSDLLDALDEQDDVQDIYTNAA